MAGERNDYGKRSYSREQENGGSKRINTGERESYLPGPEDTIYRYLCPLKNIGSIIGRGGEIVKELRAKTRAKIRIGESVPGCEERVIAIFSTSNECNTLEDTGDNVCPAQDALLRVHERLESEKALGDENGDEGVSQVMVRLLVPSDQIGCILGKGGQVIQGIRSETGAQLRIMKDEQVPACGIRGDELLQIRGEASAVKKALMQVASRLHDNPSRSSNLLDSNMPVQQSYRQGGASRYPEYPDAGALLPDMAPLPVGPYQGYKGGGAGDWPSIYQDRRDETHAREFSIRLVCPTANIGGVIGKGGLVIKQIREESGAHIKVDSSTKEDDCIISVSARELFEDPFSPTIDAAMRLQPRCSEKTERESGEGSYTTCLLVPTSQVGCLIGKGGSIISEMRRASRANIRILSKENLPKVASADDEMVQISGDLEVASGALVKVLTCLKANIFEREDALSAFPSSQPFRSGPNYTTDGSRYFGRDDKSQGRGYSSYSDAYTDVPLSDSYRRYDDYQGGGSSYSAYSRRSGSIGLPGSNPVHHGKHYGY